MPDLTPVIAAHRVLVCVGSGGVGKTTTAAALALWGALHGRRTAVVTIDPAKRLAECLGLDTSGAHEGPLPPETFAHYGLSPGGTLTALLVDQQSAWDAAVARYAPTAEIRERILANRFYQGLSRTFAGSHEYMALDTLATLVQQGAYDLIVVDTPPTRQALDFLEAPQRLQRFLDSQASKLFIRSATAKGWSALSAVNRTTTFLLRKIEEATGISALEDIIEFFTSMQRMFVDFGDRFGRVRALLTSAETAFLLVTSPEEEVLAEAEEFRLGLDRLGMALKGVVVNRMREPWRGHLPQGRDRAALAERLRPVLSLTVRDGPHFSWLAHNFLAAQAQARGEGRRVALFARRCPADAARVHVPLLPAFSADLGGLATLLHYLCGEIRSQSSRRVKSAPA
ncbi:MAG TPA: ArsA-related P-loop ATPase [Candidatus Binatia bacterium]|nr:ArsA-related P-loop ATPase [Candidatus Binatia bacterium]